MHLNHSPLRVLTKGSTLMSCVSEHVFARRNWEWEFHKASRNLIIASVFLGLGLFLSRGDLSLLPLLQLEIPYIGVIRGIGVILPIIAIADLVFWQYMEWSIETYYSFPVNVASSELIQRTLPNLRVGYAGISDKSYAVDPYLTAGTQRAV